MSESYLGYPKSKKIMEWCEKKYGKKEKDNFFTLTAKGEDERVKIKGIKSTKAQKLKVYVDDVKRDTEYDLAADTETSITIPDIDENEHQFKIELEDIEALTTLDCSSDSGIISAIDISNCASLTDFQCRGNYSISTLDVSKCMALTHLDCEGLAISTLDVSNCTALTALYCNFNELLSSLDVSKCTALTELVCEFNIDSQVFSSLNVSNCTNLTKLQCVGPTAFSTLDISDCTALAYLDCSYTSISELDVSKCTALEMLYCSNTQTSSLDVSKCTKISYINIVNTPMASNPDQPTGVPSGCEVVREEY